MHDQIVSVATLYEAGAKWNATRLLPPAIKPVHPSFRLWGPALPVACSPSDNLWIHRVVAQAEPGDILIISTGREFDAGYWGDVLSCAAAARGIGGVVIDGCVRDAVRIAEVGVPIFSGGLCVSGTTKDRRLAGSVGTPIIVGDALIERGDLVVGDADGVVAVSNSVIDQTMAAANERDSFEREVIARLGSGETTLSIYGLD
jgi:4-hydroxy-4-methyl-2-oxoglutarate aldolase